MIKEMLKRVCQIKLRLVKYMKYGTFNKVNKEINKQGNEYWHSDLKKVMIKA